MLVHTLHAKITRKCMALWGCDSAVMAIMGIQAQIAHPVLVHGHHPPPHLHLPASPMSKVELLFIHLHCIPVLLLQVD